jgi:hypothetical protein
MFNLGSLISLEVMAKKVPLAHMNKIKIKKNTFNLQTFFSEKHISYIRKETHPLPCRMDICGSSHYLKEMLSFDKIKTSI